MKTVNLGGDRIGSGQEMNVQMHGFERSTHDLSYIWRSTMACGTLVPCLNMLALPGDSFRINLNADVKTYPTVGPLFGSFKLQLDVFNCPIRLYQGKLHNNKLGIGMNMDSVKLPQFTLSAKKIDFTDKEEPIEFQQINQSSLLAYLGVRGILGNSDTTHVSRDFNALPLLSYYDIYKNYYANKQEGVGFIIGDTQYGGAIYSFNIFRYDENIGNSLPVSNVKAGDTIEVYGDGLNGTNVLLSFTNLGDDIGIKFVADIISNNGSKLVAVFKSNFVEDSLNGIHYDEGIYPNRSSISLIEFPLDNIDEMRETILSKSMTANAFNINKDAYILPYSIAVGKFNTDYLYSRKPQNGLALKTYQSDIFNNWLDNSFIYGENGIANVTAIDTSSGQFSIDTLNLSKKVYDMLNRIAVSGGSYDDWMSAVYDTEIFGKPETPVYLGGMSQEVVFQQVISQSDTDDRPLGSLGGRGELAGNKKGGYLDFRVNEPSVIIGIVSLTPRIDYSQGNDWTVNLKSMNDFHKPSLSQIGFQNLITEQMAFWDTDTEQDGSPRLYSAGLQPAWINYMTNFNKCYGEFANPNTEMFMTLNRRYEADPVTKRIKDLTSYIDPSKFNNIFAVKDLTAQNFWTQIGLDIEARRKMSAKSIPNL